MEQKVLSLLKCCSEIEQELGRPEVLEDKKRYRELAQEHAYLVAVRECWEKLQVLARQLQDNRQLLKSESDPEFAEMLREDTASLELRKEQLERELSNLLIPPDPDDNKSTILEIRAGTGGEEAALFVADCVRMYKLYADRMHWKYELLSATESDIGGYKECILVFSGPNVHRLLQYEGGIHRVQRVPATETQGRVHTSAVSVAVMLEPEEGEAIALDEKDLQIDTYRASGAGGQHVNVTDSAVRITHRPTGLVVACQDERSQLKNKNKALRVLTAKVNDLERQKAEAEVAGKRREQVGSGDRSEKIRTYNFPQNRITDHRIGLTKHNLDQVMNGLLDNFTEELVRHSRQKQLE